MDEPRILIVTPLPFNKMLTSRAFDSYFRFFKHENLAHIFSDARTPAKGHCATLFQITDFCLAKRRFNKKIKTGKLFVREELPDDWAAEQAKPRYKPRHKPVLYRWLRKVVWSKRYWDSPELEGYVKNFNPDYVFTVSAEDFFVSDIALHFAKKYGIPLIYCVLDDYVFLKRPPLIYWKKYQKRVSEIFNYNTIGIFLSDAIRERYLQAFDLKTKTIFIGSDLKSEVFTDENSGRDLYFFGKLEYGRWESLLDISKCLLEIGSDWKIYVFTHDYDEFKKKKNIPENIILKAPVAYADVIERMKRAGANLVVDGFGKNDINITRYSLSTKVGDCLKIGVPLLAYGPVESGAMRFLKEHGCQSVCNNFDELKTCLLKVKENRGFNEEDVKHNAEIGGRFFDVDIQAKAFHDFICRDYTERLVQTSAKGSTKEGIE